MHFNSPVVQEPRYRHRAESAESAQAPPAEIADGRAALGRATSSAGNGAEI